jgi:flagellar protein FliO/FliZ
MLWYIAKLLILLPLIGGMIWGSLKLSQKFQSRFMGAGQGRRIRIVETLMLSPTQKLAVISFAGREILVASGRHGMTRLAEVEAPDGATFEENFRDGDDFAQTLRRIEK